MSSQAIPDRIDDRGELVILDFDHTLFACNSTELFISRCKPNLLVAVIDFVVRGLIPWKLTRIPHWYRLRDYVCCLLIIVLTPWNVLLWRRQAPALFARYESGDVAASLGGTDLTRVAIVSFGMEWIIRALIRDSRWRDATLVATPACATPGYFARGKLVIAQARFGQDAVRKATCVTDSLDDQDLLHAADRGILIEPRGERFNASEHLYLPMRYTTMVKYPRSYALDQLLFVDILLVIAAASLDPATFWKACLVVPPLMLSVMCIYEVGYFENDMKAALKEAKPTVSDDASRFRDYPIELGAWIAAVVLGLLGTWLGWMCGILRGEQFLTSAVGWVGALIVLRGVFSFYNGLPTRLRTYAYALLQFLKYGLPFTLLVPSLPGAILMFAQISQMWGRYVFYRAGGDAKSFDRDLLRLGFFLIGSASIGLAGALQHGGAFPWLIAGSWVCARALKGPIMRFRAGGRHDLVVSKDAA